MDVLDDLNGEAKQIAEKGNDWFVYSPLLHRIREAGTLCKLFDDLDERRFERVEVQRFVRLLSPAPSKELASDDPKEFLPGVSRVVDSTPLVFDSLVNQHRPFVDSKKLRKVLRVGGGALACYAWCF